MKKKITQAAQEIAADILTEFMFARNMDEVGESWQRMYDKYELFTDPFTRTPCSHDEYFESLEEYDKQLMEQRYELL